MSSTCSEASSDGYGCSDVVCHMLTGVFWPQRGGMEDSVARIAGMLALEGARVRVYVRLTAPRPDTLPFPLNAETVYFYPEKQLLLAPLSDDPTENTSEGHRIDYLLFRAGVHREISLAPNRRHVLFSFGISTSGFLAQHVALDLGLPHVACCRGSDLSLDMHTPIGMPGVEFVARQASLVVTLSGELEQWIRRVCGRTSDVVTIHNSLPTDLPSEVWKPHGQRSLRIFSDVGFFQKKGTHLLIEAFRRLRASAQNVSLTIAGATAREQQHYWNEVGSSFTPADSSTFLPYLPQAEVYRFMLASDVYCSPSLGEGGAKARLAALALGVPMVTTRCGEMVDLATTWDRVILASPGSLSELLEGLACMADRVRSCSLAADLGKLQSLRRYLHPDRERQQWVEVLTRVLRSSDGQRLLPHPSPFLFGSES